MTSELTTLLKELESDDFMIRQSMMEKLTDAGTDEAVEALIYVANGGGRKFERKRRIFVPWGFHDKVVECYGLDDQLAAIEALSRINNQKSVDYILKLYEHKTVEDGATPGEMYGATRGGTFAGSWVTDYKVIFPNVSGMLKSHLEHNPNMHSYPDSLPNNEVGNVIRDALHRVKQRLSEQTSS